MKGWRLPLVTFAMLFGLILGMWLDFDLSRFAFRRDFKISLSPEGQKLSELHQRDNSLRLDIARWEKTIAVGKKEIAGQQKIARFADQLTSGSSAGKSFTIGSTDYTLDQIKDDISRRKKISTDWQQEIKAKEKIISQSMGFQEAEQKLIEINAAELNKRGLGQEIVSAELSAYCSDPEIKEAVSNDREQDFGAILEQAKALFQKKLDQVQADQDIGSVVSMIDWENSIIPTRYWLLQIDGPEKTKALAAGDKQSASGKDAVQSVSDLNLIAKKINIIPDKNAEVRIITGTQSAPATFLSNNQPNRVKEDVATVTDSWIETEIWTDNGDAVEIRAADGGLIPEGDLKRIAIRSGNAKPGSIGLNYPHDNNMAYGLTTAVKPNPFKEPIRLKFLGNGQVSVRLILRLRNPSSFNQNSVGAVEVFRSMCENSGSNREIVTVTAATGEWIDTGLVPLKNDQFYWGPFKDDSDLKRLRSRVGISTEIISPGINGDPGNWIGKSWVRSNVNRDHFFVKVVDGLPITFQLILERGGHKGD